MKFNLTTIWINEQRLAGTPSITYNEVGATYNDIRYNYNGQLLTIWTNEQKS